MRVFFDLRYICLMIITCLVLFLSMGMSSCDKYKEAAKTSGRINDYQSGARQIVKEMVTDHSMTPQEGIDIDTKLLNINRVNQEFNGNLKAIALKQQADPKYKPDLTDLIKPLSDSIGKLNENGDIGIKNPAAQAKFQKYIDLFTAAVTSLLKLKGGG